MRAILAFLPENKIEEIMAEQNHKLTDSTLNKSQLKKAIEQTRKDGYTVSFGEADSGAVALAAPILGNDNIAVAEDSVAGLLERFTSSKINEWIPEVKLCAADISKELFV